MAQLIVRKLEDSLVEKLRKRAVANGRSAEEEHRRILRKALSGIPEKMTFKEALVTCKADPEVEIPIPDRTIEHRYNPFEDPEVIKDFVFQEDDVAAEP